MDFENIFGFLVLLLFVLPRLLKVGGGERRSTQRQRPLEPASRPFSSLFEEDDEDEEDEDGPRTLGNRGEGGAVAPARAGGTPAAGRGGLRETGAGRDWRTPRRSAIRDEVQDIVHEADDIRASAQRMAERSRKLGTLDDLHPEWAEEEALARLRQQKRPNRARALLKSSGGLAQAVLLAEVLGPPRALRRHRPGYRSRT